MSHKVTRAYFGTVTFGLRNEDGAAARTLSEHVLAACDALWQKLCGVTPKYDR